MKRLLGALLALAVAWATLRPQPETGAAALASCLLCGPRAVADALLNVIMFVPVGMLLGSVLGSVPAVAVAFGISGLIEAAQLVIPGRDPSLGDVLFNTLGAAAGVLALRIGRGWLAPGPRLGNALAFAWGALALGVIFLAGWLLAPVTPAAPYTVQWTPHIGGLEDYRGGVGDAVLGNVRLRPGPAREAAEWSERLRQGVPIAVVTFLGPPPERLAPLLTIHEAGGGVALLLGIDGHDVVYRRPVRAQRWRLDAPAIRAPGLLSGYETGDTVMIAIAATPVSHCFVIRRQGTCGYGFDAGDGWRLFYSGESLAPAAAAATGALWLALLVLPIGFWGRWRVAAALGLVIGWYAWIRVPVDTVLLGIGWLDGAGLAAGLAGGLALGAAVRRRLEPGATSASP